MKNIQLFIHRYYDTIKLIMLAVLLIFASITIVNQLDENRRENVRQAQIEASIIRSLEKENQLQTDIINRQFRALCVIIIETSGQEGLSQLDTQSQERCRDLASNNFELNTADQSTLETPTISPTPTTPVNPSPQAVNPQRTTSPANDQAVNPGANGNTPLVQTNPVLETLNAIINLPRRVIGE